MFLSLHPDMIWIELHSHHSHVSLQQVPRFYIPLKSTCCLFFAYYREFCNRESYDEFIRKRTLKISYLTHKSQEGTSRICLIYQVVCCNEDEDSEEYARTVYFFICRNLTLPSFKKDAFVRNGYFSPTRSISVVMK